MKAVSCLDGNLEVVDLPAPQPQKGQLVLEVKRCGICGSDLHARHHAGELEEVMAAVGYPDFMRADTPVVMGHEFSGEVAERGRGAAKEFTVGTLVVSFPLVRASGGVHLTGLSPLAPGGYAEQVLVEAAMTFVVPNGLSADVAALTEPMAVALHALRRSEIGKGDVAIVINRLRSRRARRDQSPEGDRGEDHRRERLLLRQKGTRHAMRCRRRRRPGVRFAVRAGGCQGRDH